jgi:hypothetical protein
MAKLHIVAFGRASIEMTPVRHLARVHSILPGLFLGHLGLRLGLRPDDALRASKVNLGYDCLRMALTRAGIPAAVIADAGLYRHSTASKQEKKSLILLSVWPEAST